MLVVLAVLATALFVAPVSLHRVLFRRRLKPELVAAGDRFARAGLLVLALVLAGSAMLLFDVVLSRDAGRAVGDRVARAAVRVLVGGAPPHRPAGRD